MGTGAETVKGEPQRKHKEDAIKSFVKEHSIFNIGNKINKIRNV